MPIPIRRPLVAATLAAALLVAGCSSGGDDADADEATTTTATTATTAAPSTTTVAPAPDGDTPTTTPDEAAPTTAADEAAGEAPDATPATPPLPTSPDLAAAYEGFVAQQECMEEQSGIDLPDPPTKDDFASGKSQWIPEMAWRQAMFEGGSKPDDIERQFAEVIDACPRPTPDR